MVVVVIAAGEGRRRDMYLLFATLGQFSDCRPLRGMKEETKGLSIGRALTYILGGQRGEMDGRGMMMLRRE